MFEKFASVWTPVMPSSELRRNSTVAVEIAGVPVVVFRDADDRPTAMLDRCPHRGARLSLGAVEDGRLTCPFHGWAFDAAGANVHVPWNPEAKRARNCVLAFPAREIAGQIWIFTGAHPRAEPEVHPTFLQPDLRLCGVTVDVAAHWTRAMENVLDWPHLPFVHERSIGRQLVAVARAGRMEIDLDEHPWGFTSRVSVDGVEQPGSLDYRFPNLMNLFIPVPGKTLVMQIACVPVNETRTRLVMITGRNFAKLGALDWWFNRSNRNVAGEDRLVVESSTPREVPEPAEERSVRTDAPTLYFRRRYLSELRGSAFAAGPLLDLARPPRLDGEGLAPGGG